MPPFAPPTWVVPLWWVIDPARTAVSGDQLIDRWYTEMSPPKPLKKACVAELAGWSGVLGRTRWVLTEYRARAAELARGSGFRRKELDEPDSWNEVSRLYADYIDPFARFSARFAEVVDPMRPVGLPNNNCLRPLKNRVPPMVRAVLAGPVDGPLGGVVTSQEVADGFLLTAETQVSRYERVARRGYLSVLLDRLVQLRDAESTDEPVLTALEATIAEYAAKYGDPEQPLRKPTAEEKDLVHEMLLAKIAEQPSIETNPYFTEAYARAARTMLRWIVQGRENIDAGVIFNALGWSRKDALRSEIRIDTHEVRVDPAVLPVRVTGFVETIEHRVDAAAQLARAHTVLVAHVEPGAGADSWEKTLALRLLSKGNAVATVAFDTLAELVSQAWRDAVASDGSGPVDAYTFDPATAARYVQLLLSIAVSSVVPPGGSATERFARRLAKVADELAAYRRRMRDDDE